MRRWLDWLNTQIPSTVPIETAEKSDNGQWEDEINRRLDLKRALDKLTPKERVAIKRAVILGQTQDEIARSMRLSQPTVSRLLTSATEKLQALLS